VHAPCPAGALALLDIMVTVGPVCSAAVNCHFLHVDRTTHGICSWRGVATLWAWRFCAVSGYFGLASERLFLLPRFRVCFMCTRLWSVPELQHWC
jgi:hypothetical protein